MHLVLFLLARTNVVKVIYAGFLKIKGKDSNPCYPSPRGATLCTTLVNEVILLYQVYKLHINCTVTYLYYKKTHRKHTVNFKMVPLIPYTELVFT